MAARLKLGSQHYGSSQSSSNCDTLSHAADEVCSRGDGAPLSSAKTCTGLYDPPDFYIYTTRGRKTEFISSNPEVCLQVEEVRDARN